MDCGAAYGSHIDRRKTPRYLSSAHHGIICVRIRPAQSAAVVVDASASGALIETTHRLLPGRTVEVYVETQSERASVRACVVRCAVVQVRASTVFYRGGIAFDRYLPWFAHDTGYPLPAADHAVSHALRAATTREAL